MKKWIIPGNLYKVVSHNVIHETDYKVINKKTH